MSALNFTVSTGETAITSTAKTVATVVAPAHQRVRFKGFDISGKGTSNTDSPVKIEFLTFASMTGGTAGSVVTSKQDGSLPETIQSTTAGNYTAEPTYTTPVVVRTKEIHPQTGETEYFPSLTEIIVPGGGGFAVRLTSVQNETLAVNLFFEE